MVVVLVWVLRTLAAVCFCGLSMMPFRKIRPVFSATGGVVLEARSADDFFGSSLVDLSSWAGVEAGSAAATGSKIRAEENKENADH